MFESKTTFSQSCSCLIREPPPHPTLKGSTVHPSSLEEPRLLLPHLGAAEITNLSREKDQTNACRECPPESLV